MLLQESLSQNLLSLANLERILDFFLDSHQDLSKSAKISVDFEALILRQALKSENKGWRNYPVQMWAQNILGKKYWPKERIYVNEEYTTIPFPFQRISPPAFIINKNLNYHQLIVNIFCKYQ